MPRALRIAAIALAACIFTPVAAHADMDAMSITDWATSMAGVEAPAESEPAPVASAAPAPKDAEPKIREPRKPSTDEGDDATSATGDAVSGPDVTGVRDKIKHFDSQPGMGIVGTAITGAIEDDTETTTKAEEPQGTALEVHTFYVREPRLRSSRLGCPNASECGYFKLMRERWENPNITYRVNEAGRPDGAPAISSAVGGAAAEWNRWVPSISLNGGGSTEARPGQAGSLPCGDGINTVGWRPLSARAAGVSYICYDRRTKKILDIDMALNSRLEWANLSGPTQGTQAFDMRSIITHEFGHFLGLKDISGSRADGLTMEYSAGPGETDKRTLGLGDILGARAAYPCRCADPSGIVND